MALTPAGGGHAGPLRWPGVAAATAGAVAVVLGALGAHALHAQLSAPMLDVWHTAVRFQFWHALALAFCSVLRPTHALRLAAVLFAIGMVLFCGSLYALVLGAPRAIGLLTPLGGLALIGAWIALGVAFCQRRE
ncbi:MAG: DUF423 domain-containing protein [Rhodanobacteraceae bacterium]|nr:MAG: DUF423 domain-containing protein [Rhodanobacteraceae bacterium]